MGKIRSGNNTEFLFFELLHKKKLRFKKHYSLVPGRPDAALPRLRIAIFLDGDFWHGRNFELWKDRLNSYWRDKILRNVQRDQRQRRHLRRMGWSVLRIWTGDLLRRPECCVAKIVRSMRRRKSILR